jgi:hypothetical protein
LFSGFEPPTAAEFEINAGSNVVDVGPEISVPEGTSEHGLGTIGRDEYDSIGVCAGILSRIERPFFPVYAAVREFFPFWSEASI